MKTFKRAKLRRGWMTPWASLVKTIGSRDMISRLKASKKDPESPIQPIKYTNNNYVSNRDIKLERTGIRIRNIKLFGNALLNKKMEIAKQK